MGHGRIAPQTLQPVIASFCRALDESVSVVHRELGGELMSKGDAIAVSSTTGWLGPWNGLGTALVVGLAGLLPSPALRATRIEGKLPQQTRWAKADGPITIVGNVEVPRDAVLTVEPGLTIRFDASFGLDVAGTLIARGTAAEPIIFTSAEDS